MSALLASLVVGSFVGYLLARRALARRAGCLRLGCAPWKPHPLCPEHGDVA